MWLQETAIKPLTQIWLQVMAIKPLTQSWLQVMATNALTQIWLHDSHLTLPQNRLQDMAAKILYSNLATRRVTQTLKFGYKAWPPKHLANCGYKMAARTLPNFNHKT